MAAPTKILARIDPPPLDDAELSDDLQRWLANLVDTLNQIISDIEPLL